MVKQDQNRSGAPDQERKRAHATPQGSHKEKAPENQQEEIQESFLQDSNFQGYKPKRDSQKEQMEYDFDRNEGQGRSQKS